MAPQRCDQVVDLPPRIGATGRQRLRQLQHNRRVRLADDAEIKNCPHRITAGPPALPSGTPRDQRQITGKGRIQPGVGDLPDDRCADPDQDDAYGQQDDRRRQRSPPGEERAEVRGRPPANYGDTSQCPKPHSPEPPQRPALLDVVVGPRLSPRSAFTGRAPGSGVAPGRRPPAHPCHGAGILDHTGRPSSSAARPLRIRPRPTHRQTRPPTRICWSIESDHAGFRSTPVFLKRGCLVHGDAQALGRARVVVADDPHVEAGAQPEVRRGLQRCRGALVIGREDAHGCRDRRHRLGSSGRGQRDVTRCGDHVHAHASVPCA